jgi:hypothetical protein
MKKAKDNAVSPDARYMKILADGTKVPATDPRTDHLAVLDTLLRLEFHVNSVGVNGKRASPAALKKAVAKLDVLGGKWRIAVPAEGVSIVDYTRFNPAVDPNLFPGIKPELHYAGTPAAWAPASVAWWVDFSSGGAYDYLIDGDGWALAVRAAGQ